jgi:hypothetical protein
MLQNATFFLNKNVNMYKKLSQMSFLYKCFILLLFIVMVYTTLDTRIELSMKVFKSTKTFPEHLAII